MSAVKKIAKIEVIRPGSNPDVDSDFNTAARPLAIEHTKELYGVANVASIGTLNTLAAKGAVKAMCTIYEVPFAQANKIVPLIPPPIEGVECTIADIFDPSSERYSEGVDFRNATAGDEWKKIIEGAKAISGRNKSVGVHPCGIVISSKPLIETVPLSVRKDDGLVVTQWTYSDLESIGLIKMDFLGLDTVDLIQATVEYIMRTSKPVPNMIEISKGAMDDKKTFQMLARGESLGVFQLASEGVQRLLKTMNPTGLEDIVATTALFRPGPMGMLSHVRYADRKNGREAYEYPVHPDFKGSPLDDILGPTFGLVVYQESILQIASQIAGMTLQEGDDLRKAMGKKIIPKMVAMKPKFMAGGLANGYSDEALELLWDTISEFAKYGFNRAHSVGYAMIAYQSAYLKANYPREWMAALLAQNVGNKAKILTFLQEARRMGLKVGSVDINTSELRVAPDFTESSGFDVVYGLSGVNSVSEESAKIIIAEREKNGSYSSTQDLVNRCYPLGVTKKNVYENLAKAGAFDGFGVSRRGVIENLAGMINEAKTKESKGSSLFDMFGGAASESAAVDLSGYAEYDHVEKLKYEADVIGLYLTSHPLANVGPGLSSVRNTAISSILKSSGFGPQTFTVAASLTEIAVKPARKGKSVKLTIDDGTGYITGMLSQELVKGMDKKIAQERIKGLYEAGATEIPEELESLAVNPEFAPVSELEKNSVYIFTMAYKAGSGENPYSARIQSVTPLPLAPDGSLPIRMRFVYKGKDDEKLAKIEEKLPAAIAKRNPGKYVIYTASTRGVVSSTGIENEALFMDAVSEIRSGKPVLSEAKAADDSVASSALWSGGGAAPAKKARGGAKGPVDNRKRHWPPKSVTPAIARVRKAKIDPLQELIASLTYTDSGFTADKTKATELDIEKYLGVESYDFGVFDPRVLDEQD